MKRILLSFCLLAFLALNTVFSQAKLNVDSLKAVIASYPKDDTVKAKLLIALSDALIRVKSKEGIVYSDKALALIENFNAPELKADALSSKAQHLKELFSRTEAYDLANKALEIYEPLRRLRKMATLHLLLANIYGGRKDTENGVKQCERAIVLSEQIGDKTIKVAALNELGLVYVGDGDRKKAISYHEQAVDLAKTIRDTKGEAVAYGNLGLNHQILGNYTKAVDCLQKAIRLNETVGNEYNLTYNYRNLGTTYLSLSEPEKALIYYNKGLSTAIKTENEPLEAEIYVYMGNSYRAMKKYEEAIGIIEKGITINKKLGKSPNWWPLGSAYEASGRLLDAHRCYQEAVKVGKEAKNFGNMATAMTDIGRIYATAPDSFLIKMDVNPSERFPKALALVTQALEISKKSSTPQRTVTALQVLSDIYERKQDYVNAYNTYKEYITLKDSIKGEEVKNQITRKEIQYEFDKKEIELKYQQQLTADELEKQRFLTVQQRQTLTLKEQALALSNKEKDLSHLAFLKEQAEKQEKEQALLLVQKDKDLAGAQILNLAKEKALQLQEIAGKNATIGFLGVSVLAILLAAALFYLWLKKRQAELQAQLQAAFTQQLFAETEVERARIARDLHDGISHELLGLKHSALTPNGNAAQKIDGVIESIRQISRNLHPMMLESIGLQLSIETFCEQFAETHNLFINYDINYSKELNKDAQLQVFRIVQEALTNTAKHAKAQAANVRMSDVDNGILLKIQDNGKGFDIAKVLNGGKAFGLQSIIERAKIIKTKANIHSTPKGTIIELKIN